MRCVGGTRRLPSARPLPDDDQHRGRLLVIDADLGKRLYLPQRGRRARSAAEMDLSRGVTDPELLRALGEQLDDADWVLVTGDDKMPAEHGPVIVELEATIATISTEVPEGLTEFQWRVDVIHRWAHAMQAQPRGTVRRYSLNGSTVWRPRRRHLRLARERGWEPWRPRPSG